MKLHFFYVGGYLLVWAEGGAVSIISGSGEPSDKFAWIMLRDDLVRLVFLPCRKLHEMPNTNWYMLVDII